MLIVCPSCASEYALDPQRVGEQGRTVRCAACRETWFVPPLAAAESVLAEPEPAFEAVAIMEPALSIAAENRRSADADARPAPRRGKPGPARPSQKAATRGRLRVAAGLLCLAFVGGIAAGRAPIVKAAPATAGLYAAVGLPVNLRGLVFFDVRSEVVSAEGGRFLVVEGEVANVAGRAVAVPPIEIAVRDDKRQPLYTWTNEAGATTLEAAETSRFRARLASPPPEGREVMVRFAASAGGSAH